MERNELVSHWFDVWTDRQRKHFLDTILRGCKRSQLLFMQNLFLEKVPLERLDFTTVLPRFLSLYIFSFLDPRSLCRASQVSWHWKFLSEQDDIWLPKCVKLGWFLPYQPTQRDYGAWKTHYIACTLTLHMRGPSQQDLELYSQKEQEKDAARKRKNMLLRSNKLTGQQRDIVVANRPVWQDTDKNPRDLELAAKALQYGFNPNTPRSDKTASMFHDKFGISKARLSKEHGGTPADVSKSVDDSLLRQHRMKADYDTDVRDAKSMTLTESTRLQNLEEKRLEELVNQPWQPPVKRITHRRDFLCGGVNYPLPWKYRDHVYGRNADYAQVHPRIIFISSRVPAADVLADAVMFGVIPILYEYEGTTLESLMNRLDRILAGRYARSIGIFGHQTKPGEMCLVYGQTLNLENAGEAEMMEFSVFVTERIISSDEGGHLDLFASFGSCESGLELVHQLELLTNMRVNAPTGVLGNYNHLDSEWLVPTEDGHIPPPALYFVHSKLAVWANSAHIVQEACAATRKQLDSYFDQQRRDLVAQITGQMVFDAMGDLDIQGLHGVTPLVVDALVHLSETKSSKPVQELVRYLQDHTDSVSMDNQESVPNSPAKKSPRKMAGLKKLHTSEDYADDFDEDRDEADIAEEIENLEEEIEELTEQLEEKSDPPKPFKPVPSKSKPKTSLTLSRKSLGSSYPSPLASQTPRDLRISTKSMSKRLTSAEFAAYPDKRRVVAREILASESDYRRTLDSLSSVFVIPLKSAIQSNRPIISAGSIQTIFAIPLQILEIATSMEADLQNKLTQWSPQQCLGDVFIKFAENLKVYVNYCNNYSVILSTIDRCIEQYPGFRSFLRRHNRQPNTKMLTLEEVLLLPTRRIGEYVRLLSWFELHTPGDHADRTDLAHAISLLGDVNEFIDECKLRLEREKELARLQKSIIGCPSLLEANRFLIRQEDVAHLRAPESKVDPQLRVYQQIEMLGLFLFNDALVVTRRTTKHFPFERNVEHTYRFLYSLSLSKLKIIDVPDTKYVQSAFRLATASKRFYCQASSGEAKINWIGCLESAIIAYVNKN